MKKSMKVRAVLCGAFCLAAGNAFGAFAVPSTQYPTIQSAINAASSGTINVAPGIYRENLNTGTKMMMTITATGGPEATIIDGGNTAPIITVGDNTSMMANMPVVLSGFTLQNGFSATTGGVATLPAKSSLTVKNCIIKNNQADSGAAFAVTGGILNISTSVIANNTAVTAGGALYATAGSATLDRSTVTGNIAPEGASINTQSLAGIGGNGNIVYGNLKADGTPSYPVFTGYLAVPLNHSDVEGGLAGTPNVNATNIDTDPLFVDAANGNFQLAAASPAIDIFNYTGTTTDVLGISRPQGAAYDLGAYEYVAPVTPLPPVNGTCGSANGATFTAKPTTNLCSTGTATAVTGTGPFAWICAGSSNGTNASCSAQLQVVTPPPVDTTPIAVSAISANGSVVTITFSEPVTSVKPLVNLGGRDLAFTSVSGSIATFQIKSCCPGVSAGVSYILTIPAGAFKDAAGNLNPAISVSVTPIPLPAVNGTCGSSNGGIFTAAPAANLCATGTASAVSGTGPFAWSCAGSNGGTTAICSAELQVVPPADTTPPAFSSIVASGRGVTITFSEPITAVNAAATLGGRVLAFTSVSGSTATFQIKSCCTTLTAGVTYTLTIPAGAFKDAAGNPNAAVSVSVIPTPPTVVNGTCGSSNGGIFTAAPTANLCSSGAASVVSGTGPFAWTCGGSNGGTTASCSAQLQVADITPPAVVSVVVTKGKNVAADVITVTFSETISKAKSLDSIMKIGTADTTSTVSGSTVTIKVKSCCLDKIKAGKTYTLTIPAGSFKDAAGNLNAAFSVAVTM